jgi:hypothetical protein
MAFFAEVQTSHCQPRQVNGAVWPFQEAPMKITRELFDDRGEPDVNGMHDYIYVGANYTFQDDEQRLTFRIYHDEPGIACLVRPIHWSPKIYASELFGTAVDYLRTNEGVGIIKVCDPTPPGGGFIPIGEAIELARGAGLPVPEGFNG